MNHPEFIRTTWKDRRFQKLEQRYQVLFLAILADVDVVGWWFFCF